MMVGRFTIKGELGAGGMGVVYEGSDPHLDRPVAIKVLRGERRGHAERLLREAQVLAQLSHPNVVGVYEVGVHDGQVFVAMEMVDGEGLDRVMAGGPLPWRRAVGLLVQAGRGLVAAHKKGIVHRDFKPSNVMVDRDGRVRVADFGLARLITADDSDDHGTDGAGEPATARASSLATTVDAADDAVSVSGVVPASGPAVTPLLGAMLTRRGTLLGTPRYMAPEQHDHGAVTAKADQYAFCLVLWEALHGRFPFADGDLHALATAKRAGRIDAGEGVRAPGWLVRELERGLAADPRARHPSMTALLDRLERAPLRRRRVALGVVAAAGLAAAAVAGFAIAGDDRGPSCAAADASIAEVWPAAERDRLVRVLGDGGPAVARLIDDKVSAWRAARIDACRATHERREQPPEVLARRAACFDRNLTELVSLTAAAGGRDVQAWRVEDAARALPGPDRCSAAAVAGVRVAESTPRAAAVERQIADLATALSLGRTDEARALAPGALAAARALDDPHVLARALLQHTRQIAQLDRAGARAGLEEALGLASAAGDPALEAEVAIDLMAIATIDEVVDRAATLMPVAQAALRRASPDRALQARAKRQFASTLRLLGRYQEAEQACAELATLDPDDETSCRCQVLLQAHRFDDATPPCEEALARVEARWGADHPHVAWAVNDLGTLVGFLGDYDRSIALARRALALDEKWHGEGSEVAQRDRANLAGSLRYNKQYADAIAVVERGLAIEERAPNDAMRAHLLAERSAARGELGDSTGARRDAADALLAAERAYGRDHAEVAFYHHQVGDSFRAGKADCPAAIVAFTRAAEQYARTTGPRNPSRLSSLHGAAACYLDLNQPDKACPILEETLSIARDSKDTAPYALAVAHVSYGQCLFALDDKAGARTHWLEAQKIFADIPIATAERAEIAKMLRGL